MAPLVLIFSQNKITTCRFTSHFCVTPFTNWVKIIANNSTVQFEVDDCIPPLDLLIFPDNSRKNSLEFHCYSFECENANNKEACFYIKLSFSWENEVDSGLL